MPERSAERPDHFEYPWVSFETETFRFYRKSVGYYKSLLEADVGAIEADEDLRAVLGEREIQTFGVYRELQKMGRVENWMEGIIERGGGDPWGYEIPISHGAIRLLKSTGSLYVERLQQKRNVLAQRELVSRHALGAVDQKISFLEERLTMGVFGEATLVTLLGALPQEATECVLESSPSVQPAPVTEEPRPKIVGECPKVS